MKGQKHGLDLAETLALLAYYDDATLVSCDGYQCIRIPGLHSQQVQRRAFDAARTKGVLEFVDYAMKPTYGKPSGGIWRMKGVK